MDGLVRNVLEASSHLCKHDIGIWRSSLGLIFMQPLVQDNEWIKVPEEEGTRRHGSRMEVAG